MAFANSAAALQEPLPGRAVPWRERRLRDVRPLVVDSGCDLRRDMGCRDERVRGALLDWLPLSPAEVRPHADDCEEQPSLIDLGTLVRPPTIWPLEEAAGAARMFGRERAPFAWLVAHARSRVEDVHLLRVRGRAAWIARQVSAGEVLPAASAFSAWCALIDHDEEACAAVAAVALARYALSEVVAREAPLLHLR